METKANYVLVGAFTVAGFLGILMFIVWFAKIQIDRQFDYYDIFFADVTGLSVSSDVRFAGLSVGKVIAMELSDSGDGTVRVRIEIAEDTPIRADSVASLEPQGVTGVNNVSISAGSPSSPMLRDVGDNGTPVIKSGLSMLQALSDQGPKMIERLADVARQLTELLGEANQTRVSNILDNVEESTGNLDKALSNVSHATDSIATAADAIADFGSQLTGLGDAARNTLTTADTTLNAFTRTAGEAEDFLKAGTETVTGVGDYVAGDLKSLTGHVDETAQTLRDAVPGLADQMQASLGKLDDTLDLGQGALDSADRAFDGIAGVIDTDVGPVVGDLRQALQTFDSTLGKVSGDLPEITGMLKDAADSASAAFASLRTMVEGANAPVQVFARDGLPQITRAAFDMRGLIDNVNQLVSALRRNPSQLISGPKEPDFRR
ncbi:MlaD family protein [Tropicimonas sp. IMCC34043]|uniref:MlaD family protein n=1 Tax=Tropicimonas sp. IMCC34043 TaxID=2248760 RepID=UPI000E25DB39|nr:MlaD family protein [Tropicimonas sp. IMCC34043]